MIRGLGSDVIEIARVEKACRSEAFLHRVYTVEEIEKHLGKGNVLWATGEPTLREIWEKLT